MERVGIRELRNQVAAVVRRAAAGERCVITVDGVPTAQIGPLEPQGGTTLDDLAASGLVKPPPAPRRGRPTAEPTAGTVAVDVQVDRVLDDLRGR